MSTVEQAVPAPSQDRAESDKRVAIAVRQALWEHEPLRASGAMVQIDVVDGKVTLSGRVRTEAMKVVAGYIARYQPGVVAVDNRIISDPEVVRAVAAALATDERTAPWCIRVSASHGEVRLMGDVPSEDIACLAVERARSVSTVVDVRNELTVKEM